MEQANTHIQCSYAPNFYGKPSTVELVPFLQQKLLDFHHLIMCAFVQSITDKGERDKCKHRLPVLIPAVKLTGGTTSKDIVSYSGACFLDFDCESTAVAAQTKSDLIRIMGKHALYIGYSVSGKGVHMIIRIKYPDSFDEHWYAAFCFLTENGLEPDQQAKDATRKMVIGGDQAPFFNVNAIPFQERKGIPQTWLMRNDYQAISQGRTSNDPDSRMEWIVDKAHSEGMNFESGHRNQFVMYVIPMAIRFGVSMDDAVGYLDDMFDILSFPEHTERLKRLYDSMSGEFGRYNNSNYKK